VCLLTGAGGTLGNAFCRAYATDYDIVAVHRTRVPGVPNQFDDYVDPLHPDDPVPENAGRVYAVAADLEQPGEVERVLDIALARYDGVDLLVNAAAYSRWHAPGLLDSDGVLADLDRHFAVNVGVPLRLASTLARRFWLARDRENRARNRNVVNLSSLAGSKVFPNQGQGAYAASKAALNQLTRHLAAEFAPFGVRVNALAPNSFPAIVRTDSVARAIVRLDGEDVTGRVLVLDAD
jgi:NAD(P)-dependent dehydrogenase (short-subunit alcohol dehydrogenase family)